MVSQQLSTHEGEESQIRNVVVFVVAMMILVGIIQYQSIFGVQEEQSQQITLAEPAVYVTTPMTPQPVESQDFFIPVARNFMPTTEFVVTSFDPVATVPKLPDALKNISPLSKILETRGQVIYEDYQDIYIPENTIDADWTTNWRTTTDNAQNFTYITYEFDEPAAISQIRYKADWDSKAGYDDAVTMSFWIFDESSQNWQLLNTHILTKKTMIQGHILSFSPVTTQKLRVQYDDPDELWGGWGNMYEVQVLGNYVDGASRENAPIPVVQ